MGVPLDVTVRSAVVAAAAIANRRRDDRFFVSMAIAVLVTVFAGFAPTFYLRGVLTGTPLAPLLQLHGVVFTAWVVLFVVQVLLVASRRTDQHRRLGVAGAVLAAVMLIVGYLAAVDSARRGFTPPGGPPPLSFSAIPMTDLVVFGVLVGVALYLRHRREAHKRLMLMAMLAILTPAIARLPGVLPGGPLAFFGLTDLFILACFAYDRVANGRVHPAFLLGGLFVIASQPLRLMLSSTGVWLAFATWLTS